MGNRRWRNTATHYGMVAQALHWGIAILILGSYASVYYRHWFTERQTPENWLALQTHLSLGVTIAVLVVLRVLWRLSDQQPAAVGGREARFAARAMHGLLYLFLIIMPLTGYLGTGVAIEYFSIAEFPSFRDTALFRTLGVDWASFEGPLDLVHKRSGEYVLWGLVLLHAGAALYHHFVRRDEVLRRMLPPRRAD